MPSLSLSDQPKCEQYHVSRRNMVYFHRTPTSFDLSAPDFALSIALSFVTPMFVDNQCMRSRREFAKWLRTKGLFRLFCHLFPGLYRGCEALANRLVNLSPKRSRRHPHHFVRKEKGDRCTQTLSATSAAFSVVVLDTIGDTCNHLVDVG